MHFNLEAKNLTLDKLEKILYKMYLVRFFEKAVEENYELGYIHGTYHLCIGEEASHVGVCFAMEKTDLLYNTHRGHGGAIGIGMDINTVMAEIFGKKTGSSGGRGGSMHLCEPDIGYMGSNGIVGGNIPMGCGSAMAIKMQGIKDKVVFIVIGDGATNEGSFHECLNMASLWKLPVVMVCVNNDYGVSTKQVDCCSEPSLIKRAKSYNVYTDECDGNDALLVIETIKKARTHALENGPAFVELKTYRTCGHSRSDTNLYRSKEEINMWEEKCPITAFKNTLIKNYNYTSQRLCNIKDYARTQVETAVNFAKESEYSSIDETLNLVY